MFLFSTGTEDSVIVKLLKAEYEKRARFKPLSWLNTMQFPLKSVYTRLRIISRRKADFQLEENRGIGMYDIFKAKDVKMTLVEGSPGIGKTTFCLKIAYDWAREEMPPNSSFPKFEFALLLKCRDMDGDIMEAIKEQLLSEDFPKETWTKFSNFIKDTGNQEKLLIILDGLDELPRGSQHFVDKLLKRRILPFCYVLATSRQERGIEVRKNVEFDLLLEIKGFTKKDAFEYIKKHFQNVGPMHTSKGERLIREVEENTLLKALRENPLNLLLLCVIYEDYEGKLPTSRTELYQVIVQCLLKRYCSKHSQAVPEDSRLKKSFEEDILALGELAWMCLLKDCQSFCEEELAKREIRNKNLVARRIGLLYKEERLKRILKSQYEYWFLHKTFQEYLAAAFIKHKLLRGELNVFEYTTFDDLVQKYLQVFLFVSGMMGEKATVFFAQIGEKLKKKGDWDWSECSQQAATFFVESFSESGHAEQMATTLCSYIPFPQQVNIELPHTKSIFQVLKACRSFRNLQKPVKLTVALVPKRFLRNFDSVAEYIQSCSQLQSLSIFIPMVTSNLANALRNGLLGNTTLTELTLQIFDSIPCDAAFVIGESLAACKALNKVTFHLDRVWGETWASAIKPALSADTPLKSVDLNVRGSLSDTAIHGLGKLLSSEALTTFSLNIFGDMQEWEVASISRGIAQQTAVRSLEISVNGKFSLSCANVLQSKLLEKRSLNDLVLKVRGEIPDNWQSLVETLRSVKKRSVSCTFHPDPGSSITYKEVAHFRPAVVERGLETKQHFTIVLCGELKCGAAADLCEILVRVPLTSLTLKVHGKLSDTVANMVEIYFKRLQNTLSSLTIDVWDELAPGRRTLLEDNVFVHVNVRGFCVVPNEAGNALDVSVDSSSSLTPVLSEVKNTRNEKINLRIINDSEIIGDWPRLLGDALADNTSVTALDLTVSGYPMYVGMALGGSLLRSSSLTVLSLTVSIYKGVVSTGWEYMLVNSLAKMASLTTLSLAFDDRRKIIYSAKDLMAVKSLSTLSVVICGSNLNCFWGNFLRKCLEECTSLKKFCLTRNNYEEHEFNPNDAPLIPLVSDDPRKLPVTWKQGLARGLASTSSLKELTMTINNITCTDSTWGGTLVEGLSVNKSVTSLTVTVSDFQYLSCEKWVPLLKRSLAKNKTLTSLTLTVNDYSKGDRYKGEPYRLGLDNDFPENTSLTELNLTVNIRSEVSEDWLPRFCDYLMMKCSSLITVRLQVNNRCATSKSRIYDLSKLRLKYRSLSTFELSVTFYGE